MLAAPAAGPNIIPARITSIGWSVSGTGVNGSGIDTCDAAANAMAKPMMPSAVRPLRVRDGVRVVILSVYSRYAEGNCVAAAEAQRRQSATRIPILHRVQQRRQHPRATGTDRMAERDRAAVDVHTIPVPLETEPVGDRLRRERFVGLDEIVALDRRL